MKMGRRKVKIIKRKKREGRKGKERRRGGSREEATCSQEHVEQSSVLT